jgi:hypothetical protein
MWQRSDSSRRRLTADEASATGGVELADAERGDERLRFAEDLERGRACRRSSLSVATRADARAAGR